MRGRVRHGLQVRPVVRLGEEARLAVVAPLDDAQRVIGQRESRSPEHDGRCWRPSSCQTSEVAIRRKDEAGEVRTCVTRETRGSLGRHKNYGSDPIHSKFCDPTSRALDTIFRKHGLALVVKRQSCRPDINA